MGLHGDPCGSPTRFVSISRLVVMWTKIAVTSGEHSSFEAKKFATLLPEQLGKKFSMSKSQNAFAPLWCAALSTYDRPLTGLYNQSGGLIQKRKSAILACRAFKRWSGMSIGRYLSASAKLGLFFSQLSPFLLFQYLEYRSSLLDISERVVEDTCKSCANFFRLRNRKNGLSRRE